MQVISHLMSDTIVDRKAASTETGEIFSKEDSSKFH